MKIPFYIFAFASSAIILIGVKNKLDQDVKECRNIAEKVEADKIALTALCSTAKQECETMNALLYDPALGSEQ